MPANNVGSGFGYARALAALQAERASVDMMVAPLCEGDGSLKDGARVLALRLPDRLHGQCADDMSIEDVEDIELDFGAARDKAAATDAIRSAAEADDVGVD